MKVHTAVATALHDCGVERVFGLLGDANMQYLGEFCDLGGRLINAVHEGGAVSMADGYARTRGEVAVVGVTHGPGVTNTLTALTEAVRAGSPILVLTGDTPPRRDFVQQLDLPAAAGLCGAEYSKVLRPEHVADDIAKALVRVRTTHVPLILDIGYSLLGEDIEYIRSRFGTAPGTAAPPDEQSMDVALGIVASANRPLLLAGVGAVRAGAGDQIAALGRSLGSPLATTLLAKDLFKDHPANVGIFGTLATSAALDVITAADCIVAFGASLNHYTASHGELLRGKSVVHCDIRAGAIGRYSAVDAAVVGDARLVAAGMTDQLGQLDLGSRTLWSEQIRSGQPRPAAPDEYRDESTDTTLDMRTAIIELDRLLPEDRAVVTDCGRFMAAPWRYLHVGEAGAFQHTVNFGSIGLGLATAIGTAVARPDRITVAVVGDGGLMMSLAEFTTAVREQLPLMVVVLNDGSYGAEYTKLMQAGLDPKYSLMKWPEFAELARSMGGHGITVRTKQDLQRASDMATQGKLPLLVDVKADPTVDAGVLS